MAEREVESAISNRVREKRRGLNLSQQVLAGTVGVTRQAIIAIEAGRQVPSTTVALELARALGCSVEALFELRPDAGLEVRMPSDAPDPQTAGRGSRVLLGRVRGRWAAHRVPGDACAAADGLMVTGSSGGGTARVRPLSDPAQLEGHVLVAGCAPLLGVLGHRVSARFGDVRVSWLAAGSHRALNLLASETVHVAGIHLGGHQDREAYLSKVRSAFPGEKLLVVNLTRWRQGLVVPAQNPLSISTATDLLRPGLRFAGREAGAGASELVRRLLDGAGARDHELQGPIAPGHLDVARLVRCGAADVGVAIESVALAAGLGFVPLAEERFDLILPASQAATGPVSRLIEGLDDSAYRREVNELPGYDCGLTGQVTTLEAA